MVVQPVSIEKDKIAVQVFTEVPFIIVGQAVVSLSPHPNNAISGQSIYVDKGESE